MLIFNFKQLKNWASGERDNDILDTVLYDRTLVWLTLGLAIIGFIMVTSASMPVGQRLTQDPFFFLLNAILSIYFYHLV